MDPAPAVFNTIYILYMLQYTWCILQSIIVDQVICDFAFIIAGNPQPGSDAINMLIQGPPGRDGRDGRDGAGK